METSAAEWERGLGVLRAYVAAHGSATPATHLVVDGFALGRWVARRRDLFRAEALEAERVAVLEAMPGWSWGRTQRDRFEDGLTHLRTYVARHGTAEVPRDQVVDGFRLGRWVARCSAVAGELRPEWAAVLEAVPGWRWQHPQTVVRADGAGVLGDWVTEHGSAVVPLDTTYQGFPLGAWVARVGMGCARPTVPGRIGPAKSAQEPTGSASPDQFYMHPWGFTLGAWVGRVRSLHRAGTLPAERVEQVQAGPGWR